jgi:hypothetical protein
MQIGITFFQKYLVGYAEKTSIGYAAEAIHPNESDTDDSIWKAKYEELEKRYDQLLSILGGGMRQANVG